jgi:hypothetical protein
MQYIFILIKRLIMQEPMLGITLHNLKVWMNYSHHDIMSTKLVKLNYEQNRKWIKKVVLNYASVISFVW